MKNMLIKNKKYVLISMFLVLVTVITTLIAPFILNISENESLNLFQRTLFLIVCAMLLCYFFQVLLILFRENFAKKLNIKSFFDILHKMYQLKYEKYIELESGNLVNRLFSTVDASYMFITTSLFSILKSLLTIAIIMGTFFFLDELIFWICLFLIPLNFFSYKAINQTLSKRMKIMQSEHANAQKDLISLIGTPDQFKLFKNFETVKLISHNPISQLYSSLSSINKFAQVSSHSINFINQMAQNIIFLSVSFLVSTGNLQLSNMMVVSIMMPLFFSSLSELSQVNVDFQSLKSQYDFISHNLDNHQEVVIDLRIDEIEEVIFNYPIVAFSSGKEFAFPISEKLYRGDICYIEGDSGVGKSTLLKSLLKFYFAKGIFINGIPINQIGIKEIRENISFLSQNTQFFSDTLENNLSFRRGLTLEQKKILTNSRLLEPILKNIGWESMIVDNGSNLSGGEKQRILIARMIVEDNPIWILDESTSSIDKESSDMIFETVVSLSADKIILYTSHDKENRKFSNKAIRIPSKNQV